MGPWVCGLQCGLCQPTWPLNSALTKVDKLASQPLFSCSDRHLSGNETTVVGHCLLTGPLALVHTLYINVRQQWFQVTIAWITKPLGIPKSLMRVLSFNTRPEYNIVIFLWSTPWSVSSLFFKSLTLSVVNTVSLRSFLMVDNRTFMIIDVPPVFCPFSCLLRVDEGGVLYPAVTLPWKLVGLLRQYLGMIYLLPSSSYASVN